jgi:hypothetical protein
MVNVVLLPWEPFDPAVLLAAAPAPPLTEAAIEYVSEV